MSVDVMIACVSCFVLIWISAVAIETWVNHRGVSMSSAICKQEFTPSELEVRHVRLNTPFEISSGQEVLVSDAFTRPVFRLKRLRTALKPIRFRGGFQTIFILDGSLEVSGITYEVQIPLDSPKKRFANTPAGMKIAVVGDTGLSQEDNPGQAYIATVMISRCR